MNQEVKRKMRIDRLWKKISEENGVHKEMMISYCSITWGLSRRTAREYLNDLINMKFVKEVDKHLISIKKIPSKSKRATEEFEKMMEGVT
tara:strand:+ start:1439 stop:1708 length:270 start_codon:yes stop_codon:yes gene_type:complete